MQPTGPQGPIPTQRQKPASMATYKRLLRKEIKRRANDPEINFLNITAMMDMMTIILVFLLKSMSTSSASLPQSNDLQIPRSVLSTESSEEGVPIVISKSHIMVEDESVIDVPQDATHGVEAKYKRGGPNDLYITKLGQTVKAWRDTDRQIRIATHKDPSGSEAIIIADKDTPYRLLVEVLFTLGQNEYNKFHLMVLQSSKAGSK
ncbi:MAG TPA: biopolymer transporter ExbD [Polyangiaceae bacterium]|jgi:biopolymer transport protein ExbD